jgi:uncharacterized membrane protein YeaQ/YmgE (transglycosylase-associated protein family)
MFRVEVDGLSSPILKEQFMGIITWIVLGLLAGFIASKIVNNHGAGLLLDIVLGVVGAIAGGWIFTQLGARGVSGLNFYSLAVSTVGAVLVLLAFHAVHRTH